MARAGPNVVVGVDEAGRGSLLGPLVVGAFAVPEDRLEELTAAGAADSKQLSPGARERAYRSLRALGSADSVSLGPATIDRAVDVHGLNRLEASAFGRLVARSGASVAYLDACDVNAARFAREVARHAGGRARLVARHHADRDLPIVGAASIVAKVRRDRWVAGLARRLATDVGSGYPSDPTTIAFVRRFVGAAPEPPRWVRRSWSTMQRVIADRPTRTLEAFDRDG